MYLPSKITNILSKITKSYTVKYTNGKIESVFISEKDVTIQASNKGYCIYLKGGPIYLNDLKSIEPLLVKMNVLNNNDKIKNNKSIKDELIDIFSKNKDTFSVEYNGARIVSLNLENPKLVISKTRVGYSLYVNNEIINKIGSIFSDGEKTTSSPYTKYDISGIDMFQKNRIIEYTQKAINTR